MSEKTEIDLKEKKEYSFQIIQEDRRRYKETMFLKEVSCILRKFITFLDG